METNVTVVRIYLSESDHKHGKTLMQDILDVLHDQHKVKRVTVLRGIAGIGDTGEVRASNMLRIMVDLPIVIEFVDTPEVVNSVLELLGDLVPAGHIVSWPATCR